MVLRQAASLVPAAGPPAVDLGKVREDFWELLALAAHSVPKRARVACSDLQPPLVHSVLLRVKEVECLGPVAALAEPLALLKARAHLVQVPSALHRVVLLALLKVKAVCLELELLLEVLLAPLLPLVPLVLLQQLVGLECNQLLQVLLVEWPVVWPHQVVWEEAWPLQVWMSIYTGSRSLRCISSSTQASLVKSRR